MLNDLLGHLHNRTFLEASLREPFSAYLFTGPDGIGKRTVALHWLAELLDERVLLGKHPDVHIAVPEKNSLKIDQIRDLLSEINDRPCSGSHKIYLLDGIDTLTAGAANMLLKPLEEPPPRTIFILVATNVEYVLPTIRSRCQEVEFQPAAIEDVYIHVCRFEDDEIKARLIANLSEGSFGLATKMIAGGLLHYREKAVEFLERFQKESPSYTLSFVRHLDDPQEFFFVLRSIVCDLFFLKSGLNHISNLDLNNQLTLLSKSRFVHPLYDSIRALSARMDLIESNFPFHLQTELVALKYRT